MNIRRFHNNTDAVKAIANELRKFIDEHDTPLWLMSGGSNVPIQIQVAQQLSSSQKKKTTVSLVDERYGEGSNFSQLKRQGFDFGSFKDVYDISNNGADLKEASKNFDTYIDSISSQGNVFLQLGFGSDGHVAGLKDKESQKSIEYESNNVVGFEANDYSRISLQLEKILEAGTIVLFASGDRKIESFAQLTAEEALSTPLKSISQLERTKVYLSEGA